MIAAMAGVSCERGIGNVTVADIVARSGVSRRTFYELFANRDDCFLAALDDAVARASGYLLHVYDPAAPWRERMRMGIAAILQYLDDEPFSGRMLVVESLGLGSQVLDRRAMALAPVIAAVDDGRKEVETQLPALAAEGVVGGVLAVLHTRLLQGSREPREPPLSSLANELTAMVVLPYLGPPAARRELQRRLPRASAPRSKEPVSLKELEMRLTYRTFRVLVAVAAKPGSSNRHIAEASGITDQGQISKLLARLHQIGLIENSAQTGIRGAPNAWGLTELGSEIERALVHEVPLP